MRTLLIAAAAVLAACASWAEDRAEQMARLEREALARGWTRETLEVSTLSRQLMWRAPSGPWTGGAIVALHGGGGSYSNFGANVPLGQPMVEFAELARSRGFAVFAPDSTDGKATDEQGRSYGKRWDSMELDWAAARRTNIDVPFLARVIDTIIPARRPAGSSNRVLVCGISNGGYMTILAATQLGNAVDGFAAISCGDPYGTIVDLATKPSLEREHAPGVFRDRETGKTISEVGAAEAATHVNERRWPDAARKLPFKQFHHAGDALVDLSNPRKARAQLVAHGYIDHGEVVVPLGAGESKKLVWHFWLGRYNAPLLDFFASLPERR